MVESYWSGLNEYCFPKSSNTETDVGVIQLIPTPILFPQPESSAPQRTLLGNRCSEDEETGTEPYPAWFTGHFLERHYLCRTHQTPCLGSCWLPWMPCTKSISPAEEALPLSSDSYKHCSSSHCRKSETVVSWASSKALDG